jgi:16S rRNA (uracil1498-N3)-methyltransferase
VAAVTPRSAAAHVFVDSLDAPELADADRHHLERVLRLAAGTVITVGDGRGGWRQVELGPELEQAGPIQREHGATPAITVAFALVKGDRPELIARALTEVGVDRLVPVRTSRTVVRWDGGRASAGVERLRRVVLSAGMQCRRVWLPEVGEVTELEAFLATAGPTAALAEPGGPPPELTSPTVVVGPEGGWSAEERASARATVGLGPHVLRTETAAIVAGALLVAARRDVENTRRFMGN